MKLIQKIKVFLVLYILMLILSCTSTSKITEESVNNQDIFSAAYYMQFKNSEERLAQLMCGRFSCYKGKGEELFLVNNDKDSIIVETVIVGDKNKDGVWIYKESFMSHYPEQPLVQLFQKIERVSPDSLNLHEYRPKSKENKYVGYYKKEGRDIDIKDFVSTGCSAGVKKLNQTEFEYYADMCQRNRGDKEQWIDIVVKCTPIGLELRSRKYSEPSREKENIISTSSLYYKRLGTQD